MSISQEEYNQFIINNGFDFTVEMVRQTIQVPTGIIGTGYCPVRTDTHIPLSNGGMSSGFTPIQNRDAFSIIPELSNVRDMKLVRGGTWGNGAGVYAQISLGDMNIGSRGDTVGKYLSVINSHDGSHAMNVLITPFRHVCSNQITAMIAEATKARMITIRHTASASRKLQEMINTLKIADGVFERTGEIYNNLASTKVNEEYVKEVLNKMFPLDPKVGGRGRTIWQNTMDAVQQRYYSADKGRSDVHTAWNLYNAVQGTIQHDGRNTITKDRSVLMGSIAQKSAEALSIVLETCSSQNIPQSVKDEINSITA